MPQPSGKPLRRSRRHRILGGVCGGFAEWRGWRPTTARIVFLISTLAIPGVFVYLVLWAIIPPEPLVPAKPKGLPAPTTDAENPL